MNDKSRMSKILPIFMLVFVVFNVQAQLTAQLDSTKIQMGQTVHLTLSLDDPKNTETPDLSALRHDFTLVGSQRMVSYTLINGKAHSLNQWIILLMPKHPGKITVPVIQIGQEITQERLIEVTEENVSTQPEDGKSKAVKFVTQVSELNPYVNQQIIYTVKLYNNRRLLDADYQPPKVKDALMVSLGNAKRYQVTENGVPYAVEELQYGFFPQKSGELTITPPQFRALLFDSVMGKVQIRAKTIKLHVKPEPVSGAKQHWLPAKKIYLTETYDSQGDKLVLGAMVVRTVTVKAVGVAAQLLPSLSFAANNQFSVYPETPTEETQYQHSDLLGVVTVKVTYLFNKPGTVEIPELKLPWFNTLTDKPEVASLSARTITVIDSAMGQKLTPTVPKSVSSGQLPITKMASPIAITAPLPTPPVSFRIFWTIVVSFIFVGVVALFLWWWMRNSNHRKRIRLARKQVRIACVHNDPNTAKDALIHWARNLWPQQQFFNLTDIEKMLGECSLSHSINRLSQHLYDGKKTQWLGKELWLHFAAYKLTKEKADKKNKLSLPPINP